MQQEDFMTVEKIRDEGQKLDYPSGKVVGIVDTRAVLDGLTKALETAGFKNIEILSGEEGVRLLERVNEFFFSDMEDRVLARHLKEVEAGHFVISIKTPSNLVDEAVAIATANGAHGLVHFGWAAVTWLTK